MFKVSLVNEKNLWWVYPVEIDMHVFYTDTTAE